MSAPAAAAGERGGFGRSRREGAPAAAGGDKRPRDGARPPRKNARAGADEKEWVPITKLGRLVLDGRIRSLEEIFLFSIPIKEYQIVDRFLPSSVLKDEVMKVMPVQKQTSAGQRTRFKAFVVVGDFNGHLGLGCKCAKEVATSIRGAIINAKMNILPIRRGYWGVRVGAPHTVPYKLTGKCGSVRIRLVPAPRGTGLVAAPITKKVLAMAGLDDCYTSAQGHTRTLGNFVRAMYNALSKSYGFLSPDLWAATEFGKTPFQEHTDFLANKGKASRQ